MLTSTKHLLSKSKVVPAFNWGTLEVARGIFEAGEELSANFIFELNEKELEFVGVKTAFGIVNSFSDKSNKSHFSLHVDHCYSAEILLMAAEVGFTSGLLDTSKMGLSDSVTQIKLLVTHLPKEFLLEVVVSSQDDALRFEELGADLLAVEKDNFCDLNLLRAVNSVTKLPLVMHGGSSRKAFEIKEAIKLGVVKINFNTCLRQAYRQGLENTFKASPKMLKSYELLEESTRLVKEVAIEKMRIVK